VPFDRRVPAAVPIAGGEDGCNGVLSRPIWELRRRQVDSTAVRALRRHIVIRFVTCFLLTLAAADLFVPQLCSSEEVSQAAGSTSSPQDQDDCFCCCSHIQKALVVTVVYAEGVPVIVEDYPLANLSDGIPRGLYHPPLVS